VCNCALLICDTDRKGRDFIKCHRSKEEQRLNSEIHCESRSNPHLPVIMQEEIHSLHCEKMFSNDFMFYEIR